MKDNTEIGGSLVRVKVLLGLTYHVLKMAESVLAVLEARNWSLDMRTPHTVAGSRFVNSCSFKSRGPKSSPIQVYLGIRTWGPATVSLASQYPQGAGGGGGGGGTSATGGPTAAGTPARCRRMPSSILSRSCRRMYQTHTFQDMNTTRGMTKRMHRNMVTLNFAMRVCGGRV